MEARGEIVTHTSRHDSAGTVLSAMEIEIEVGSGQIFSKAGFVTYCQFLHLERRGLSLGQQAGKETRNVASMKIKLVNGYKTEK